MCRKCLDVIQSKHVTDFVRCSCQAISIDGGASYLRVLGHPENFVWDFEEDVERNDQAWWDAAGS